VKLSELKARRRKELLGQRASIDATELSRLSHDIVTHIVQWLGQASIKSVFSYMSHKNEVCLQELHNQMTKVQVYYPVIVEGARSMEFYSWVPGQECLTNKYGISEPDPATANTLSPKKNLLIILPALAIDWRGFRLGYGGGFYDAYLDRLGLPGAAAEDNIVTMGLTLDRFLVEELPAEDHDLPVDYLVTESGVTAIRGKSADSGM